MKNLSKQTKSRRGRKRAPILSVVMAVCNAEKYVAEAIESILSQTFRNFELIIVDDTSSDSSWKIIQKYSRYSKRIRTDRNARRKGIPATFARAINMTRGEYIAMMNQDAICYKTRFEKQLKYLKNNRRTVAVGAGFLFINKRPTLREKMYERIFRLLPSQPPGLMIARKRLPRDFEYFNNEDNFSEADLVTRLLKYGKVEKLPFTLLKYRMGGINASIESLRKTYFLFFVARLKGTFYSS